MKIILFLSVAVLHTAASQLCNAPTFKRRYHNDFGDYTPCQYNITLNITCNYSRIVKYEYKKTAELCPNDYIRLRIQSNDIGVLPGSSFEADFEITELCLNNTGVTKITPGAFNNQYKIQYIHINQNKISLLRDGIFTSLTHLENLDLSENQITDVNEDAFSSVPLKELNLSRNAIPSMPGSALGVKILDMSYNSIKYLPAKTFSTTILNVSNNQIPSVDLINFPDIKELHIANNAIKKIDFPISMEALEVLDVGSNRITSLPNKTLNWYNLRELYLNDNGICAIPVAFMKNLRKLEVLDLSKNSISVFTFGTFDGLQSLKSLNISSNEFKTLPLFMFHSMKDLRNLYFSYNKLTDIDAEGLLKYVPKLETADIRGYFLSCYKLLEIVHKLGKHGASVVHGGSTTGHNIYGMNCTEVDDSVDVKEKYHSPEIQEGYAALVNYFNKDFRNSNFVQYPENLKNVGNRNEDFNLTRNLTDILADTKLTMNKLIKTGDAQSGVLEKIMNEIIETRTKWEKIYMPTENNRTNINQDIENTLKEILNYTEISEIKRDEYLKGLVQILKEKLQVEFKLPDTQQVPHTQESSTSEYPKPQQIMGVASQLISSSANTTPRVNPPILTFMAVLLTIITALLFLFGYIVFNKGRYFVNPASDVEMAHLVESRPDSINK